MNTTYLLMAQFGKAIIPLSDISEAYLSLKTQTATNKYNAGELELPLIRLGKSQKSPLMVRVQDLAAFIDEQAEKAKKSVLNSRV